MKKNIKKLIVALLAIHLGLMVNIMVASAADNAPAQGVSGSVITPIEKLQTIGEGTNLPSFHETGRHADAPADYKQKGIATIASPFLFIVDLMRFLISGIALLVIFISAIKLMSNSNEEEAGKTKNALIWGVAGLILIQFADAFVKKMFFGEQGEAFESQGTSELFAEESVSQIRGIIGLVQMFIGAVSVLVIVIRGFMLITNVAGDEESQTKAKTHIMWAIGGLVVVGLSEVVVVGFLFPEAGEALPDVDVGKKIIISLTNYVSGFVAILAFANLFIAGYRYVVSGGNEEINAKVKSSAIGSLIAILLALGAFAVVNTFIKLEARPEVIETPAQAEINLE